MVHLINKETHVSQFWTYNPTEPSLLGFYCDFDAVTIVIMIKTYVW